MRASPGLRIAGGTHRGRRLAVPPATRPTEAKVRQALFSIWLEEVRDCRFLDLFAGSGAMGLEALSRGALEAVLVESDRAALEILRRNATSLFPGAARVLGRPVLPALESLGAAGERFDLVFADPPYRLILDAEAFTLCAAILDPRGRFALEHAARDRIPAETPGLVCVETRRYGESALSFFAPG